MVLQLVVSCFKTISKASFHRPVLDVVMFAPMTFATKTVILSHQPMAVVILLTALYHVQTVVFIVFHAHVCRSMLVKLPQNSVKDLKNISKNHVPQQFRNILKLVALVRRRQISRFNSWRVCTQEESTLCLKGNTYGMNV